MTPHRAKFLFYCMQLPCTCLPRCLPSPPLCYQPRLVCHAAAVYGGAGVHSGLQWLISVAGELDKGTVTLATLNLHHPLVSQQALLQLLHSHYMRAALPKLLKIMGHANVLGKLHCTSMCGQTMPLAVYLFQYLFC